MAARAPLVGIWCLYSAAVYEPLIAVSDRDESFFARRRNGNVSDLL